MKERKLQCAKCGTYKHVGFNHYLRGCFCVECILQAETREDILNYRRKGQTGYQTPEQSQNLTIYGYFVSIVIAFIIATVLFFIYLILMGY